MYERALNIIDKNKLTEEDIRTSELKVEILEALGRYKEALAFSREVVEHTKMLHDEAFNRQINQLRTLHDLNIKRCRHTSYSYVNNNCIPKGC